MGTLTKTLFYVFMIICLITGLPLLLAPGRFLALFAWAPIDPLISRLLGAALLGMAWGAWRSLRQNDLRQAIVAIEIFIIFCLLGAIGWFRHLFVAYWWPGIWVIAFLLLVFGLFWGYLHYQISRG